MWSQATEKTEGPAGIRTPDSDRVKVTTGLRQDSPDYDNHRLSTSFDVGDYAARPTQSATFCPFPNQHGPYVVPDFRAASAVLSAAALSVLAGFAVGVAISRLMPPPGDATLGRCLEMDAAQVVVSRGQIGGAQ